MNTIAYQREWARSHRENRKTTEDKYRKKNPEKVREWYRNWYQKNKAKKLSWNARYLSTNPNAKLAFNLRTRFRKALERGTKTGSAVRDLGCSIKDLRLFLEERFSKGMNWKNYGLGWHVDHIVPLASFDLSKREQVLKACHYSNLQPLWAKENLQKGAKRNS